MRGKVVRLPHKHKTKRSKEIILNIHNDDLTVVRNLSIGTSPENFLRNINDLAKALSCLHREEINKNNSKTAFFQYLL